MQKLIIIAAICGAEVTKEQNPAVPYTIEELAKEAELAVNEGASILHLHVREDDGTPTQRIERFREAIVAIRQRCPSVILQLSTGGALGMSNEERFEPIYLEPEMASLDCGTINYGHNDIFVNSEDTIMAFGRKMKELSVKPEIEVFDKGMIDTALRLASLKVIHTPMHFNFVLGVQGGIGATVRDLSYLVDSIPSESTFSVAGIGKEQFNMAVTSIVMGGHVRVGFEDNLYIKRGKLAKSNGELVKKIASLAKELGREIATPDEARKILGIKNRTTEKRGKKISNNSRLKMK